jgi:hypothetical protein
MEANVSLSLFLAWPILTEILLLMKRHQVQHPSGKVGNEIDKVYLAAV